MGADPFYFSQQWRQLRAIVLREHPICQVEWCDTRATDVDHIKDRATHPELELSRWNLQALCRRHHSMKTGLTRNAMRKHNRPTFGPDGMPLDNHPWAGGDDE